MIVDPLFTWFGLGFLVVALLTLCIIPCVRGDGPRWRWFARMGVVLVLGVALARPGIPVQSTTEEYETAADVYFLVDTTTSMAAEDYDGDRTRLEGVKKDMLALAEQFPGTRLSIITFASTASTAMPLTTDHAAFASAVDVLSPELSLNSNGSSITEAGAELDKRMKSNREDRPDNKTVVFYFGDGEQTVAAEPDSWASFSSRIDDGAVFGYGTAQGGKMKEPRAFGSVPNPDQEAGPPDEYIRDSQGNPGISTIDESNLRTIAEDLGVDYHHRDGGTDMAAAYTAPKYEQTLVKKDDRVTVDEYFWVPLILVFGWLVVEMVIGVRELNRLRSLQPGRVGPQRRGGPAGRVGPAGRRGGPGPGSPAGSGGGSWPGARGGRS
ncbi:Ca-activated chloride channel family protein [Brevibacterium sanguinis]|uniref:Ca-activated chloride channel family protein n=2 Tax=Brevibacterium TaxID=1696 RepID=A0A366IPM8_9MICO|nr:MULTISPECIES: VWA domain-containing protein [Brevibacterium]RBP68111.1 Ca-activated chloride channel family protein [Brevibacterium sanguinis]RBP74472.1 Ca-activated chloride channel family protein [Brevibacterium celere]